MPTTENPQATGRGFDKLSLVYDRAVKLVFGNKLDLLSEKLIFQQAPGEQALIIGGGTGKVLKTAMDHGLASTFVYAEQSTEMMRRARRRLGLEAMFNTEFMPHYQMALKTHRFDYILVPFVLDCYTEKEVENMLGELKSALKPDGRILLIDFNLEKETGFQFSIWKKKFIAVLYCFFHLVTGISAKRLARFHKLFHEAGFQKAEAYYDADGWIQAVSWTCISDQNTL